LWTVDAGEPSPKFQLHEVGVLVDVSVKPTDNGAVPDDTVFVNDATGGTAAVETVTGYGAEMLVPPTFVAVSRTLKVPVPVKMWVGLRTVEAGEPSPKFHDHDVGSLVDVSVKPTDNGAVPDDTVVVNDATGVESVTETVVRSETVKPAELVAVRRTS
jgi:hypothetical protein